jgi:putative Mn2+ efflux pump MntP
MGFTIGLLKLSIALAVVLIGVQAFAVAQFGQRLNKARRGRTRMGGEARGAALVGLGILILAEKLMA